MKTKELLKFEHECRMKEIESKMEAEKEVENLKFNNQLQLQRIRSAEIKKSIDMKSLSRYGKGSY